MAPGGGLHDLSGEVTDIGPDFFAAGGLDRVHSALSASGYARWPVLDQAERVGSCVSRPGKVVCVGLELRGTCSGDGSTSARGADPLPQGTADRGRA